MSIDHGPRPLRITLTALVVVVLGVVLAVGGGYLATLGGSWYYLIAGVGLLLVAGLLFARRRAALWLYAALLLGTLAWTLYEVRFDWWQLAVHPRALADPAFRQSPCRPPAGLA